MDRAAFNQGQNAQYEAQITQSGVAAAMVARGPAAIAFGGQMSTPQVDMELSQTLQRKNPQTVAVDTYNQSVSDVSIPLRVGNAKDSLPAAMVPQAVAFKPSHYTRGKDGAPSDVAAPLSADADKGDQDTVVAFTKSKRAQSTTDDETWVPGEVSPTMSCFDQGDTRATTVVAIQERAICENPGAGPDGAGIRSDGVSYTLEARTVPQAVAYDITGTLATNGGKQTDCHTALRSRPPGQSEASTTTVVAALTASGRGVERTGESRGQDPVVAVGLAVRRLTPRECERLQGFPDDYTLVEYRKKPAADGPRYRALGNSMAVPVMRWIGERIAMVDRMP
jgi:site-specific DNA-cytosine methylase